MLNKDILSLVTQETSCAYAEELTQEDISALIDLLCSKENSTRYSAFLLLRARSAFAHDVYPYWDTLAVKLHDVNSYQRSIGAMLLAANARWDTQGKARGCLAQYLALLNDEKPITVRQCVQSLADIALAQHALAGEISAALIRVNPMRIQENMRKLVLSDILEALLAIRTVVKESAVDEYILSALSGNILDNKSKKKFRAQI